MLKYTIIYYSSHPTHGTQGEVGYATHQRETINALEKLGHTVIQVIMGNKHTNALIPIQNTSKIKLVIKKLIPKVLWITLKDFKLLQWDKKAAKVLLDAINMYKPHFIYERSEVLQVKGSRLIKKLNIPYFLEVNAPFVQEMQQIEGYSLLHNKANKIEKEKLQNATKICAVSTILIKYLTDTYAIESSKFLLAPNRINFSNFNSNKTLNAKDTVFVYGFVGSILPFHKVELLINAFNLANNQMANLQLLIVGDGAQKDSLVALVNKLNLNNKVTFTGKIPHNKVHEYLNKMHVCVMPGTNWYGSPVKIFEYGAMGKPIIAPNEVPLKDVMQQNIDGVLINQTQEDLCEAMVWTKNNYEKALEMAGNFKQKIKDKYTWEHAAKEIITAFEETQ